MTKSVAVLGGKKGRGTKVEKSATGEELSKRTIRKNGGNPFLTSMLLKNVDRRKPQPAAEKGWGRGLRGSPIRGGQVCNA